MRSTRLSGVTALLLALLLAGPPAAHAATPTTGNRIAAASAIGPDVQAVGVDSFAGVSVAFPGGVRGLPDQTYETLPGYRPMKLDLFLPPKRFDAQGPRPFVFYIHGGGWAAGGPRRSAAYKDWPRVLASLSAQGYVVASVGYRFAREAPFPAAIQDVKAAIRWLKANASLYHVDPNRGMTWGQSAGGHLAALAAVSCGVPALAPPPRVAASSTTVEIQDSAAAGADLQSDCVQGAVAWFGIYDFGALYPGSGTAGNALGQFLGCTSAGCTPEQLRAASPLSYVSTKAPPMLIMHGTEDKTVPLSQSQAFYAALQAAGVASRLIIVPGVGHSWIGPTPAQTQAASRQALAQSVDFIEATIGDRRSAR